MYVFLDRGEGRKKEEEKCQCVVASCAPLTEYLAHNTGMCPDRNGISGNSLVHRLLPNPLSHTSQGYYFYYATKTLF